MVERQSEVHYSYATWAVACSWGCLNKEDDADNHVNYTLL